MSTIDDTLTDLLATQTLDFLDTSSLELATRSENYDKSIDYCLDILDSLITESSKQTSNKEVSLLLSKLSLKEVI